MHPKNTITQLMFIFSIASLSICHIIRRDASEETSFATVTEELSSNELGNYPNDLTNSQEDDGEEHQELSNELGSFPQEEYHEGHDVDEEGNGVETSMTSTGVTTRDITTLRNSTSSIVVIETSTSHETLAPTASTEQPQVDVLSSTSSGTPQEFSTEQPQVDVLSSTSSGTPQEFSTEQPQVDVLTGATSAAPLESITAAPSDHEFSLHNEPCGEPSAHQLRLNFKQGNQNVKFPALAILKKESSEERSHSADEPTEETRHTREEYVNMTCPRELLHVTRDDDEVNMRSLCPWTYVADVDPNRYPSKIMFAVCRCPECIRIGGGEDGEFSVDNTCRPVYFRMKVLRKGSCVNGLYVYNTEYQRIPVACACVRPKN